MKRTLKRFGLLLIIASFISCGEESSDPAPTTTVESPDDVIGVWNYVSINQENGKVMFNGFLQSTFITTSSKIEGEMNLKASGNVDNYLGYTRTATFTIKFDNSTQTQKTVFDGALTRGTYVFDKDKGTLKVTLDGESTDYTIVEHTDSKLVIKTSYVNTKDENGNITETSADIVITMTK